MKKLIILFVFLFSIYIKMLGQEDLCASFSCEPGWTGPVSTGWVWLQVGVNPNPPPNGTPIYCLVDVCYCYNFNLPDGPNYELEAVFFRDPACKDNQYFNIATFKKSIITQIVLDCQNIPGAGGPIPPCNPHDPQYYYYAEFITAACYQSVTCPDNNILFDLPCGSGKCEQLYTLCWDMTQSPPVVQCVLSYGPIQYGVCEGYLQFVPYCHEQLIYGSCTNWCQ